MYYLPGIIVAACMIGIPLLVVFIKKMKECDKLIKEHKARITKYLIEVHRVEPEELEGLSLSALCMIAEGLYKKR